MFASGLGSRAGGGGRPPPTFYLGGPELEVYIGSDINGQPDPTKCSTNPNTTRYPNGENRTTWTRPDSELPSELNVDNWNDNCEAKVPGLYAVCR